MSVLERFVGDDGRGMVFDPLWEVSTTMWTKRGVWCLPVDPGVAYSVRELFFLTPEDRLGEVRLRMRTVNIILAINTYTYLAVRRAVERFP